ncbi:hypothetical protein SAMN04488090_3483 [Siphonobacter aquaeclarae]|uniref:Lipocalin-like domain-containing protein n=2 Tax=Siphonobacter aquaeclarae TaxID=563176 RepID=A0A1G9TAG9_9BACT|nr:hypothetical protein SAMN04488090_3483 [Siphonobacter aquaeclarae]
MRKFFLVPFLAVSLSSCSKKDSPQPVDLSAAVAGTYQVTYAEANGQKLYLPVDGISMGVKLTKNTLTECTMKFTSNIQGKITSSETTLSLKAKELSSDIDLYESGAKIGSVNVGTIDLNVISDDGQKIRVKGTK